MHINSATRGKGTGMARAAAVLDQLAGDSPKEFYRMVDDMRRENLKAWKNRVNYGRRWLVEIVFSSFKRMFGESVRAIRMENILQEIRLKVHTYNAMLAVAKEVIAMA